MKTTVRLFFGVWLLSIPILSRAQQTQTGNAPSPTPFSIVQRDANSRLWQRTTYETSPSGQVIPHLHQYNELASGLCYQQNGQWVDSQEQINILPDGSAAAINGQHQAYFPADINNGEIKLVTPDGLILLSRPLGLSYDNGTNTVLIAELTNSVGQLISSNQVIYTNAFIGLDADLLYTYRKGGFEQDVVFREQPPGPETFGMDSTHSRLQMLTEFFNPPTPAENANAVQSPDGLQDTTLTFGKMKMIRGRTFSAGTSSPQNDLHQVPVYKSWVLVDDRTLLIEQTPYRAISSQLTALPANTVSLARPANSMLYRLSSKRLLPLARVTQENTNKIQLARADIEPMPRVVMDYVTLDSGLDNFTFQGDTTYYITGLLGLSDTTTLEGETVIKFEAGVWASLIVYGSLNCEGGAYRPSVLTASDDNSVGEGISGSSGNPSGYYAANAIDLEGSGPIDNLRILYAYTGVYSPDDISATNVQIMNCGYGFYINDEGDPFFENVLITNAYCAFGAYLATGATVENATVVNCSQLFGDDSDDWGIYASVYNTILANVSSLAENEYPGPDVVDGNNNGLYNSDTNSGGSFSWTTTTNWPFQTVGGGSYYLATNTFQGLGTTNIDPALLADLAQKTTQPPIVYDVANISSLGTLGPAVSRDTNSSPDLGYHYDPLDYVFGGCNLSSNLTFTAGTAVGWFEDYGGAGYYGQPYAISLNNGANLTFNGNATQPDYFIRFDMAQEAQNGNWSGSGYIGGIMLNGSSTVPQLSADFTKFPMHISGHNLFRDDWAKGAAAFKNCEFDTGGFSTYDMQNAYFTNCLFFRYSVAYYGALNLTYDNCTFYSGGLKMDRRYPCIWQIENCSFDGTAFAESDPNNGSPTNTLFNYNAYNTNNLSWTNYPYLSGYGQLETNGPNTVTVTNFNWQSSWFGDFYLPPDSPLIQAGSTNANLLGLYHFTTQTSQTPEGANIVDIGYHYVATDTYGNPLSTPGDGIPDYIADANGNGIDDPWETPWDIAFESEPQSTNVAQGQNVTFSATVSGIGPFTYQWLLNSNPIAGATSTNYTILVVPPSDDGNAYSIIASNADGHVQSTNAILQVNTPIVLSGEPQDETVTNGGNASFSVTTSSGSYLVYQWYTNGVPLTNSSHFGGVITSNLTILNVHLSDESGYYVVITNVFNSVTSSPVATLTVVSNPVISSVTFSPTNPIQSQDVTFTVVDAGWQTNQWYFSNSLTMDEAISGATHTNYTQLVVQTNNDGFYHVIASSLAGSTNAGTNLNVLVPPWVTQQPVSALTNQSSNVTFTVTAIGTTNLGYQWFKNGTNPISWAITNFLTLTNVQATNAGGYSVLVTNRAGTNMSAWGWLSVSNAGVTTNGWGSGSSPPAPAPTNSMYFPTNTSPTHPAVFPFGLISIRATATNEYGYITNVTFMTGTNSNSGVNFISSDGAVPGPSPIFALAWSNAVPGTNIVEAVAKDYDGQTSTSAPVYVLMYEDPTFVRAPDTNLVWEEGTSSTNISLTAVLTSIGQPYGYQTNITWTSTPAATIASPNSLTTTVTFSASGTYTLQLEVGNGYGTTTQTTTVRLLRRPQINIIFPTTNSAFPIGTPLVLKALATSVDSTITNVTFYTNSVPFGPPSAIQSLTNSYTFLWTPTANGTYSLTAVAADGYGLTNTSTNITVTIYNPYPFVQIISPINQLVCARSNVTVTVVATNSIYAAPVGGIQLFAGTNTYGGTNNYPTGAAFNTNNLSITSNTYVMPWIPAYGGTYFLSAEAVATNGLAGWSQLVTNFVRAVPSVVMTSPFYGQFFQEPPTNVTISATATADSRCTITNITLFVGTPIWTNSWAYTFSASPLNSESATNNWLAPTNGTFTLWAEAIDSSNAIGRSSNIVITVEPTNRPPQVYAGPNQTNYLTSNPLLVQLNGRVSDDGLPLNEPLTVLWTNLNGDVDVVFAPSNAAVTEAYFNAPGTNILQLSANDTQFTNSSDVTIVILPTNSPPYVYAGIDQTNVLPAFSTNVFGTLTEVPINGNIPYATGIDYFPASHCLVASINYALSGGGQPINFELVDSNGDVNTNLLSTVTNLTDEVYIATVRNSMGGFNIGEMFTGNGVPGEIMRIEPDGTTIGNLWWTNNQVTPQAVYSNVWIALPTLVTNGNVITPGELRGGLWVDRTGVWGGDLIVSTTEGNSDGSPVGYVWRINSAGQATFVAQMNGGDSYEGVTTCPNDPTKYGPFAGCILVGGDDAGNFFAINTNGFVAQYDFPFGAEDIRVIPQNENLFGCDQTTTVWGISANQFSGMVGDILVACEGVDGYTPNLYRLHWNGQQFETYPLLTDVTESNLGHHWEGINFAPAGLLNLPSAGWVQLDGIVIDGVPTINTWSVLSEPTNAQVEFSDSSQTNTSVNFNVPGTYILQLSAFDGQNTVSSNVTITVLQNQAPWVFAGTNQYISTYSTTLQGVYTNYPFPPPYDQVHANWTNISGPPAVTFYTPSQTNATVKFSNGAYGSYVLCLTVDDGQATNSAYVTINYLAPTNFLTPGYLITPTNGSANLSVQLVDQGNSPITNTWVQYHFESGPGSSLPDGYLLTSNDGTATLQYTDISASIGPDIVQFWVSNYDSVSIFATNHWAQPTSCGDEWLGQQMSSDLSVEPWTDGTHYADYYALNENAGDTIHLGLVNKNSGNVDAEMIFLRNSNQVIAVSSPTQSAINSDNGSDVYSTALNYPISTAGEYIVEVTPTVPNVYAGVVPYDLYLSCGDDTNVPNMEVLFNGTNVPNGGTIVFPTINVGASTNISLIITNTGQLPVNITGVGTNALFALSNNIQGVSFNPNEGTNINIGFTAITIGTTVGSLLLQLQADYPSGSNYVIYFMANTTPTNTPPAAQMISPANGSTFFIWNNVYVPIAVAVTPGSADISGVTFDLVLTDSISSFSDNQAVQEGSLFIWTNAAPTIATGPFNDEDQELDLANLTITAIATDVNGEMGYAPPVVIHLLPYYSLDPNLSPQFNLFYDGTNVPGGGTIVFPQTTPGTPVNVSLTITNGGNYPLGISSGQIGGDFVVSSFPFGQAISNGISTNIEVTFNASATGTSFGQMILSNNASAGGCYVVNLVANAFPSGYVPPSDVLPIATNEQFTVLANSVNNILYPLYFDSAFDTNTLTITSLDTSTTTGKATIINNGTAISYTPQPGYRSELVGGFLAPEDGFYYTISDAAGHTNSGTISIVVYATDTPDITLIVTNTEPYPGESDTLTVTNNSDDANIASVTFYLNNQVLYVATNTDSYGNYVLPWNAIYDPTYRNEFIQASANDMFGQVGVSQPETLIFPTPTNPAPIASLSTYAGLNDTNGPQVLTNSVTIRDGVFNVYGQAFHPDGDSITWRLDVYSSDGTTLIRNLITNDIPVGSLSSSSLLGMCDLSTLQNGVYQLVLTATSDYVETNASIQIILESNLKIGQFSFSQQDLVIPVSGIPLTVTRTYNSINPVKGDFGYGWTYTLDNMNVSLDESRQDVPDLDGNVFSERTGGSYDVTLTLPNGQVTTFYYYLTEDAYGDFEANWKAAPGVTATLRLQDSSYGFGQGLLAGFTDDLIPPYWDIDPDTPFNNYDFPGFILQTEDGTQYEIDRQDLDDHTLLTGSADGADVHAYGDCYLSKITDRDNNTINIDSDSIVFKDASGQTTRQIAITRNADNLISSISDPNGISSSGPPALQYQYDSQDNLIAVEQLVNTNGSGTYVTNTFSYTNTVFPHYITGIINANGTQVAKNFYDDNGQLIAVQDANGNLTQFIHNLTNSEEVVIDRAGNTNSYVYDSRGNVIIQTNALNQVTAMAYDVNNNKTNEVMYLNGLPYSTNSYFYDANNNMLSSTDPLGYTSTNAYNVYAQLTVSTDARTNSTFNNYDNEGNLISTVDALHDPITNIYSGGLLIASVDPVGTMTTNTYDNQFQNLTASATVNGNAILSSNTFTYDANGNRLTSTVWRQIGGHWEGDTTANFYDAMNRIIETINPDGGTNITIYNATGQQATNIDANENITSYVYDDENRLIQTTYPDGTTTSSTYDANGNRKTSTDQESRVTQYQYDSLNRLTNTIYPDSTTSATIYDQLGRVAQTIDARGTITANGYDVAGRRTSVTNAFGTTVKAVSSSSYDPNGNQITSTDADGHTTTSVYDVLNRQVQVQYPGGTTSETVYDADGRSTAQTNQDGIATLFGYDGSGRLTSVTNAAGTAEQTITQYQYDEAGNEIGQIDALLRTNTFVYDSIGRKIIHLLPGLQQKEGWAYDFNGNQISYTNLNNTIVYNQYDSMNRLTNRTSSSSGYIFNTFTYTPTGQRAEMFNDSSYNISEVYDSRDRLLQRVMSFGNAQTAETLTYGYDANGNVTSIKSAFANGVNLAYAYDPLNRLTNVLANRTQAAAYLYDLSGNLTGMRYGNGVTNQYQYDSLNRLTNLVWNYHNSPRASFAYGIMPGGTRTSLAETTNGSSPITYQWSYDHLYRLTNENISVYGSAAYAYDGVGNRTNLFSTGGQMPSDSYTYDTNDVLVADNTYNETPDGDNNMQKWGGYDWQSSGFPYDYLDRMTYADDPSGDFCDYGYDNDGNSVWRQVDNGNRVFEMMDDHNPSGYPQVVEEFTSLSQGPVLTRVYNYGLALISQQQFDTNTLLPSTLSYYGYDGHGNVRFLMDTSGNVTDTYTFDAYGNLLGQNGTTPNDFLYCGLQYDRISGLYNNRARRLFSPIGEFTTRDGDYGNNEDPLSLHKYLYGEDDPVNMEDPSGNIPIVSNKEWGNTVHERIAEDFKYSDSPAPRNAEIPISQILGVPWKPSWTAGIPDLVQYPNGLLPGQIYEIKPEGSWLQGEAQLYWYLGLLNGLDPQKRKWAAGSMLNYRPPSFIDLSPTTFAVVSPPLNGVILYHVEDLGLDAVVLGTYMTADLAATWSVATLNDALAF